MPVNQLDFFVVGFVALEYLEGLGSGNGSSISVVLFHHLFEDLPNRSHPEDLFREYELTCAPFLERGSFGAFGSHDDLLVSDADAIPE